MSTLGLAVLAGMARKVTCGRWDACSMSSVPSGTPSRVRCVHHHVGAILFLQVGVSPVLAIFPRIRTLVDLVRYMAEVRIGATEVFLVCFWIHRQKAHASVFRRARVPRFRERLDFQNRLFLKVL